MQVKLGKFSFTLPGDWRDTSSYTYKAKDKKVALTISFGKTREAISLEDLVAQRRQHLSETMGDEIEFISQEPGKVAALASVNLSFSFGDQDKKYLEQWATAYYGDNKYVALSYVGPLEDESLAADFERIVNTCMPSSQAEPTEVDDGYIWRQAHILRMQVPESLVPPRNYTYVSTDGSLKLKASLYNPGDNWPNTSVADEAARDLRFGGTRGETQEEQYSDLVIEKIDYVFQGGDPLEPVSHKAHRAHAAGFGARLFLSIKGFESQSSQIDSVWQQIVASLIEQSNPSAATPPPADEDNNQGEPS